MLLPAGSALVAFFFLVVLVLGVGSVLWRVSTARRMAERSGLDVDDATTMALLTEDGLPATYLASTLRPAPPMPPPASVGDAADRLRRLRSLLSEGLITQSEHDERRRAIIDEL